MMRISFGDGCTAATLDVMFAPLRGWTVRANGRDGLVRDITRDDDGAWLTLLPLDPETDTYRGGETFRVDPWEADIHIY